ncbi:Radical_SAM domain containing protein [uncultured Caudovirales phage]|uniref:Radical_SAM domain containing protein n=1 Tax=uncultured Caudovirales phage TaxID=2100421 RepID=A0A6J5KXP6_9CAUD|nr:Radical_SAM domain containing protein [uncultured Caudovirales phage]CAB5208867.1 Radical_SAM domain containing protein [uncultured Caudovirales phage]
MKKIIQVIQPETAPLNLTWVINNICTNQCSYCPSDLHAGTNHNYDWENARQFFKMLFKKYPKVHCSISGGEPSVSPFLPEVVDIFSKAGNTIGLTSNGAKTISYWSNISKNLNYVCFSYHSEFPDPQFLEKVDATSKNTFTTVRVMMHSKNWDQCLDIYTQAMAKNTVFVEPVRMVNWGGDSSTTAFDYTPEQLDWFDNNRGNHHTLNLPQFADRPVLELWADFYFNDGSIDSHGNATDYTNKGMTNFHGYTCEAGLKGLFINWLGDVYLANCGINGAIGNIDDPDNIKWPTGPVICNKTLCHCSSDININKRVL